MIAIPGMIRTAQARDRMTGITLGSPLSISDAPNIMIVAQMTPIAMATYIPEWYNLRLTPYWLIPL